MSTTVTPVFNPSRTLSSPQSFEKELLVNPSVDEVAFVAIKEKELQSDRSDSSLSSRTVTLTYTSSSEDSSVTANSSFTESYGTETTYSDGYDDYCGGYQEPSNLDFAKMFARKSQASQEQRAELIADAEADDEVELFTSSGRFSYDQVETDLPDPYTAFMPIRGGTPPLVEDCNYTDITDGDYLAPTDGFLRNCHYNKIRNNLAPAVEQPVINNRPAEVRSSVSANIGKYVATAAFLFLLHIVA
jgi:hypothetical protein